MPEQRGPFENGDPRQRQMLQAITDLAIFIGNKSNGTGLAIENRAAKSLQSGAPQRQELNMQRLPIVVRSLPATLLRLVDSKDLRQINQQSAIFGAEHAVNAKATKGMAARG